MRLNFFYYKVYSRSDRLFAMRFPFIKRTKIAFFRFKILFLCTFLFYIVPFSPFLQYNILEKKIYYALPVPQFIAERYITNDF